MKHLAFGFLLIALLYTQQSLGQSRKIIFVEHFSNTKCPICQNSRADIYEDLKKYKGEINHMTIHRKYPYSDAPLYAYNKKESDNREAIYAGSTTPLNHTPTLCVNSDPGTYRQLVSKIDAAMKETEVPVALNMTEKGQGSKEVTLKVANLTNTPKQNLFVYAALVEKVVNVRVSGKDYEVHDVFRKFLGNKEGSGDPVGELKAGAQKEIKLTGNVPSDLEPSDLYVIAWVEERVPDGDKYKLVMHNSVSVASNTTTNTKLEIPTSELTLYPNPVSDQLHIQNTSDFAPERYRIVNNLGQEIRRGYSTSTINTSELTPGNYILVLENDRHRVTRPFIK